nr:hypothetical protein [Streptacidiphilus jiangxiensis]
MAGRGLAGLLEVNPADDVAVGVGLQWLEDQLVGAGQQLAEVNGEVLVVAGVDGSAGLGDRGDGFGDVAVVGVDRGGELGGLDLVGPAGYLVARTDAMGWSVGKKTCALTVLALSYSLGSRNAKTWFAARLGRCRVGR